jgi:outer membrane immunogenic protein
MYRALLVSAAACGALLAAPALAQPATGPDWTGFYIGLNAGGAWGSGNIHTTVTQPVIGGYFDPDNIPAVNAAGSRGFSPSGFTGGAQGGYNWQSGALVLGLETDFEALDLSQSRTVTQVYPFSGPDTFTVSTSAKTNWMWTLRPRVGWAGGGWLIYGTGGLAVADVDARQSFHDTFGAAMSNSHSNTRTGWTLGAGVERAIAPGWSIRGEYLYADFGSTDSARTLVDGPDTAVFHNNTSLNTNIFRAAVNFKF